MERRAAPGSFAGAGDRTAVRLRESFHQRQPDPESRPRVARSLALREQPEHAIALLEQDSGALIADFEDCFAILAANADHHGFPARSELERVVYQIRRDLLDPRAIAVNPGRLDRYRDFVLLEAAGVAPDCREMRHRFA